MRPETKWYTDEIREEKVKRRQAESRWRKSKLTVHLEIYKAQCCLVSKLCKAAKRDYYHRKIEECHGDQKKLFQITKELMNKRKTNTLPSHVDSKDIAESFSDYFTSKITKIRDEFPLNVSDTPVIPLFDVPVFCQYQPVSCSHLQKTILSSNSKSCHLDLIPTTVLKSFLDTLLPVLCKVVNGSLASALVPPSFKVATVTPLIKKPSLNKEDFKNYRPVSNLPYLAKLTEREAVRQLNSHMESHSLHEPNQSAYKASHSTETALLKVYNDILE